MSEEIHTGFVAHGIMKRSHHKVQRDPYDTLVLILSEGFEAEMSPKNPNTTPYPLAGGDSVLFIYSDFSFSKPTHHDKYVVVMDPPLDQRVNDILGGGNISVGRAPKETIKEVHIRLGCEPQETEDRKQFYQTNLESYLSGISLIFHQ